MRVAPALAMTQGGEFRSDVSVDMGRGSLEGTLVLPAGAEGLILFAHGSGSSRHSPRNRAVAEYLNERALATLLFDLLTPAEEQLGATAALRFDVDLLGKRLVTALSWTQQHPALRALPFGVFGASTGAAAALLAAATRPELVRAVVSRGGRPDLAGNALGRVQAPTLLLVGGADSAVLSLNEAALARLAGVRELIVIPGAGHLFEEPGALDAVAKQAGDWFLRHLAAARRAATSQT